MTDEPVSLSNTSAFSSVVPLSPDSSIKPADCVLETPQKKSKLPAGLLPAFEMLLTRNKSGANENVKQQEKTDAVARKLHFSNNPTSRLALSTIQTYGSVEPKPNLQVLAKPIWKQEKSSSNAKRSLRSVSPVQRKKTKSIDKHKSGVGHGIRKPRPQSKTDNKQISQASKSSIPCPSSQLSLKLQAIKNKLKKDRLPTTDTTSESPISMEHNIETWTEDEEHSVPIDDLVEKLDTCPDLQDIVQAENIFIESEQEINKINELMHIVKEDGSKEFLPSSSSPHELEELVPIGLDKIQEVESLLSKLFGEEDQVKSNNSLDVSEVLQGGNEINSLSVECSTYNSGSQSPSKCGEVEGDSENSVSTSYLNQSLCSALDSHSVTNENYLMELDILNEKLNQSNYIDPNDTDPFEEYEETDSSFIIDCAHGSGSKLEAQYKLIDNKNGTENTDTELQELSNEVSMESTVSEDNEYDSENSNVPSTDDYQSANSSLCQRSSIAKSDVSSNGTFYSTKSSPKINNLTGNETKNKLFPLFEKGKVQEAKKSSPVKLTPPRRNFPLQEKDGKEQLILDAGQKKFGMVMCEECQFLYDPDDRKDVDSHFKHHNRHENNLKHLGWKNERVVAIYGKDEYVILVKEGDPSSWWKRVRKILDSINYDLGFAEDSKLSPTSKIFLYIWKKNIVGCIVSEDITQANRMLPGPQDLCTEEFYPATCGIVRIWTSKTLRLKGFASKLMIAVMENFFMTRSLELSEIAFSSPTPDGRAFASKFLGTPTFLVY